MGGDGVSRPRAAASQASPTRGLSAAQEAGRAEGRQGRVRIQVSSVEMGRAGSKGAPGKGRGSSPRL